MEPRYSIQQDEDFNYCLHFVFWLEKTQLLDRILLVLLEYLVGLAMATTYAPLAGNLGVLAHRLRKKGHPVSCFQAIENRTSWHPCRRHPSYFDLK